MTLIIQPMQPFVVEVSPALTPLQLQALIHLYQPLIGAEGLALYLSLQHIPANRQGFTQRKLHSQFIQTLNMGIHAWDLARKKLEACGLLQTYRHVESTAQVQRQTLLYRMKLPLEVTAFIQDPLLSSTLERTLGQEYYQQVLGQFVRESVDLSGFQEITTAFDQMFKTEGHSSSSAKDSQVYMSQLTQSPHLNTETTFSYPEVVNYLEAEQLPAHVFTEELKQEVLALHQVYTMNEMESAEVVKLAYNSATGRIQLERLNEIASKRSYYRREQKERPQIDESIRKEDFEKQYPSLDEADIDLMYQCHRFPIQLFLEMTKRAIRGFVTDSERYYVRELEERSELGRALINYLIYYLLVIQHRPNLYKGELQRLANEWQQKQLSTIPAVMDELRREESEKEHRQTAYSRRKASYQEPIPQWMENEGESAAATNEHVQPSQEEIRARLDRLMKGEDA